MTAEPPSLGTQGPRTRAVHHLPQRGKGGEPKNAGEPLSSSPPRREPPPPPPQAWAATTDQPPAEPQELHQPPQPNRSLKLLHIGFQEPQREKPSAKEHTELPANRPTALSALVRNLYGSGKFQFPATGSCCAGACRMTELSQQPRLLRSGIYTTAATHEP